MISPFRRKIGSIYYHNYISLRLFSTIPISTHYCTNCNNKYNINNNNNNNNNSMNSFYFSKRYFWNPFSTQKNEEDNSHNNNNNNNSTSSSSINSNSTILQHQRIMEKAHRDATLHNERLVDACLDLLDLCGSSSNNNNSNSLSKMLNNNNNNNILDKITINSLVAVVEATLHDFRKTPAEQFDLVYFALCLPITSYNNHIYRCLMVILEAFLPEALFRVFESENLIITNSPIEEEEENNNNNNIENNNNNRRAALLQFVHALLGEVEVPEGIESEELIFVYLEDVRRAFPQLINNNYFIELQENATNIAMRAKLYTLLSQLCAEFDKTNCGKVKLSELQETIERVVGKEKAKLMLAGAQPDNEGKIAYKQLTSLLTRPPPRR